MGFGGICQKMCVFISLSQIVVATVCVVSVLGISDPILKIVEYFCCFIKCPLHVVAEDTQYQYILDFSQVLFSLCLLALKRVLVWSHEISIRALKREGSGGVELTAVADDRVLLLSIPSSAIREKMVK